MGGIAIYNDFAGLYDRLMNDVDYGKWADYLVEIFNKNGLKPRLIADLGCGTGSLCIELSKRGYDMIGMDLSCEMLSFARTKAADAGQDILFTSQDMTSFELYGTVDVILSMMDSINYVTGLKDLRRMFKLVNNYLNPGGLFIFDINTAFKIKNILGNNVFYSVDDDVSYIWQNSYDTRKSLCTFDLTFFVKQGDSYSRFDETHTERAYQVNEIKKLILQAGMVVNSIYDQMSFKTYNNKSERIFFVCSKKL